jgi:putative GTP pyrophosphokinase
MATVKLSRAELASIETTVDFFVKNRARFERCANILHTHLSSNEKLRPYLHSSKYRVKQPEHLSHKLKRMQLQAKAEKRDLKIAPENLFVTINDLAGVRLIHLHTDQFAAIKPIIAEILEESMYRVTEGPTAKTWDLEYKKYFESLGIKTEVPQDSMYTSVHYVIEENSKSKLRCELQVRTLSEELWGEVSHTVDYPDPTASIACKEQLKVLARLTTGSTRLVDSIFKSLKEHARLAEPTEARKRKR